MNGQNVLPSVAVESKRERKHVLLQLQLMEGRIVLEKTLRKEIVTLRLVLVRLFLQLSECFYFRTCCKIFQIETVKHVHGMY